MKKKKKKSQCYFQIVLASLKKSPFRITERTFRTLEWPFRITERRFFKVTKNFFTVKSKIFTLIP